MRAIRAADIVRLVQTNELTRVGIWEFVRRHDPTHVAALVYMLENVRGEPRKTTLGIGGIEALNRRVTEDLSRPRKSCRCGYCRDSNDPASPPPPLLQMRRLLVHVLHSSDDARLNARVRDYRDSGNDDDDDDEQRGLYSALEMLEFVRDAGEYERRNRPCRLTELALHNLATRDYSRRFLCAFASLLLPEHLHRARDVSDNLPNGEIGSFSTVTNQRTVVSRFVTFVRIYRQHELLIDPTNFNYVVLPRPVRDDTLLTAAQQQHATIVQELHQGFSVMLNYCSSRGNRAAKLYNAWGELVNANLHLRLRDERAPRAFVAHAVLLPVDRSGRERSWRYWRFRASHRVLLVDLFGIDGRNITDLPFAERLDILERRFGGAHGDSAAVLRVTRSVRCRDALETQRAIAGIALSVERERLHDLFETIVGVAVRRAEAPPNEPMRHARFDALATLDTSGTVLDRSTMRCVSSSDSALYRSNEAAHYKFVALVYAHDDEWLYACRYETRYQQFVHAGQIERTDLRDEPNYRCNDRPVVLGAPVRPRGVFYARIYCDRFDNIVGVDSKRLTASRHDLPLRYPPMLSACCPA